jgi:hypothetical protein
VNHEIDPTQSFLSWQGQVTGPHTLREIQNLLKLGKIHSLYKIQVEGEWNLLRDHLASMEKSARDTAKTTSKEFAPPPSLAPVPKAILVPADEYLASVNDTHTPNEGEAHGEESEPISPGMAIASFGLSLLFFIPFLNVITWLLALIFGHLALSQGGSKNNRKSKTLAWLGLWISYVEISFFLIVLAWFSVIEIPNMELGYLVLHGRMLGNIISALIGAGVLMLAVKMVAGKLISFAVCFVGALLPSAVGALGMLVVHTTVSSSDMTSSKGLTLIGIVNLILFVGQMFFWAKFIRVSDDEELGLPQAALASLLYTFIFVFIGIGYLVLFAALAS